MKWASLAVVVLGWLLFGASFFLGMIVAVQDLGSGKVLVLQMDPIGWLLAHKMMESIAAVGLRTGPLAVIVAYVAASTNIIMLASPWGSIKPRSRLAGWLPLALLAAIVVNLGVFGIWNQGTVLGPGYYMWQASFLVVAVGLYMMRRKSLAHSCDIPKSG